jgi:hypothetical protein
MAYAHARNHCLDLSVRPASERILAPHGDVLIEAQCRVIDYDSLPSAQRTLWAVARYEWTLIFTAESTVREEEVVLFETTGSGRVRPVWHMRFETGPYAIWRSVSPEIAPTAQGTILLSVLRCVNGTGGCAQVFIQRHPNGNWARVIQDWIKQLPQGLADRIRHGARIDPGSLRGEAGLYAQLDPNCCPSGQLTLRLALQGDRLVLFDYALAKSAP